ncbi:MAG: hypothetical protein R2752_15100 [Vicinamibacterales bacterium]
MDLAAAASAPFDWTIAFALAELPLDAFHEVAPGRTPPDFADELQAGRHGAGAAGSHAAGRTAAFRGRPDAVRHRRAVVACRARRRVRGAWHEPLPSPGRSAVIVILLPIGAALLARHNVRLNRGDRRGALSLGTFTFFLAMAVWAVSPTHGTVLATGWTDSSSRSAWHCSRPRCCMLVYSRWNRRWRVWPHVLITWARVSRGGLTRDPLVGRDLVIGTLLGLPRRRSRRTPAAARRSPEPIPGAPGLTTMLGARWTALAVGNRVLWSLQNALVGVLILTVLRLVVQRDAGLDPATGSSRAS